MNKFLQGRGIILPYYLEAYPVPGAKQAFKSVRAERHPVSLDILCPDSQVACSLIRVQFVQDPDI